MICYHDVAAHCLFRKTRIVSRYITNIYTKSLKDLGITPVQFTMLTALQIQKGSNVNTLSSMLTMDRTTTNRNLKPLIRDGLVITDESEDKREKIIHITEKGENIYKEGYLHWKNAQEEFKDILGEELHEQMHEVFDKVLAVIAQK